MIKTIDALLNKITMYRLVLYELIFLLAAAAALRDLATKHRPVSLGGQLFLRPKGEGRGGQGQDGRGGQGLSCEELADVLRMAPRGLNHAAGGGIDDRRDTARLRIEGISG